MKAIEVLGTIEKDGRVRLIVLVGEEEPNEQEWLRAATRGGAFDLLSASVEDLYTLRDGKPFAR